MLTFAFFLGAIFLFIQSAVFPHFSLIAYAPWIALVTLVSPFPKALWLSTIAGCLIDLVSDDPIGVHALAYTGASALLFRFRNHFLYENPLHFSLFTVLVSFVSTNLDLFLLFLFDRRVPFTGKWILADLIAMPIADGIYGLVWFAGPLYLFINLRRNGSLYWQRIKQSLFPI